MIIRLDLNRLFLPSNLLQLPCVRIMRRFRPRGGKTPLKLFRYPLTSVDENKNGNDNNNKEGNQGLICGFFDS